MKWLPEEDEKIRNNFDIMQKTPSLMDVSTDLHSITSDLPSDTSALPAEVATSTTEHSFTSRNTIQCPAIEVLHQSIALPGSSWMDVSAPPIQSITLCKVSNVASASTQPVIITHCLKIENDLTWALFVHNHKMVKEKCSALEAVPDTLNSKSLHDLLVTLDQLHVCCGQPDAHFVSMLNAKKKTLMVRWLLLLIAMLQWI